MPLVLKLWLYSSYYYHCYSHCSNWYDYHYCHYNNIEYIKFTSAKTKIFPRTNMKQNMNNCTPLIPIFLKDFKIMTPLIISVEIGEIKVSGDLRILGRTVLIFYWVQHTIQESVTFGKIGIENSRMTHHVLNRSLCSLQRVGTWNCRGIDGMLVVLPHWRN
jgi:hypothetical protein